MCLSSYGMTTTTLGKKEEKLQAHQLLFPRGREASYYTVAVLNPNSTSYLRTLYANNLQHEGLGRGPHGKPDRKWKAQPAPAASAAQPS